MASRADVAPIRMFDRLDSSNAEARRRAESGERGPVWLVAREQTAGRGRLGRRWRGGEGDLAATLLTTTRRPPSDAARVAFVAALAVADLASAFAPDDDVRLKWPNDLLLGEAKAAGVLVESGRLAGDTLWLAVGVGVNLLGAPQDLERPVTALADHLRDDVERAPTCDEAADILAHAFADRQTQWDELGFASIADAWTRRAAYLGRRCATQLPDGRIEGVAEGLEADGALRLRLDDGALRRVVAGDVFPVEGSGVVS